MKIKKNNDLEVYGRYHKYNDEPFIEINLKLIEEHNITLKRVVREEILHHYSSINKCRNEEHLVKVISENWEHIENEVKKIVGDLDGK